MQISSHNVLLAAQQSAAIPKASSISGGASFAAALKELPSQAEQPRDAQTSAPARPTRPGAMLDIKV